MESNKSNKTNRVWARSLLVVGITSMILAGSSLAGVNLSDTALRVLGILDMIALFVLVFLTAKKMIKRN